MANSRTPQERVAVSLQLNETVAQYLKMETWTPVSAALLMCGIHPPPGCTDVPSNGVGLDNAVFRSAGNDRFHDARSVLKAWRECCEDGQVEACGELPPYKFLLWCKEYIDEHGLRVDPVWVDLLLDAAYGSAPKATEFVPIEIANYVAKTTESIPALLEKLSKFEFTPLDRNWDEDRRKLPKLPTGEIARLFEKVFYQHADKARWKKTLGDPPEGLKRFARATDTKAGVAALWDPVAVAVWLRQQRHVAVRDLDSVFKNQSLATWLPLWNHASDELRER